MYTQINNYFVKSIKQAKTARWILGWSHTSTRLQDVGTQSF
jgi:methyltransferase